MLILASYLAENTRPTYERIATWLTARLGEPTSLLGGVAWDERLAMLDNGRVQVALICGWSYIQRHDRPERPVSLLCAPVMAPPRYEDRPIYFTDVVVRHGSSLRAFADLRGQSYAYNDRGSHSGYNVPRDALLRLGETRGYFGRVVASGSHQASLRMVEAGEVDASGIDSTMLDIERHRRPELSTTLRTVAVLGPSPIPPVIVTRALREPERAAPRRTPRDARGSRGSHDPRQGAYRPLRPRAGRRLQPDPRDGCPGDRGRLHGATVICAGRTPAHRVVSQHLKEKVFERGRPRIDGLVASRSGSRDGQATDYWRP
jgi:phosphonate transport system substrate-binding protein